MDYRLAVDRQHILQGLKLIKKSVQRVHKGDRAVVGFGDGWMTVEAGEVTFVAQATGAWPGNATVSATLVRALSMVPPKENPIVVACDGEYLWFGALKVPCVWQPVSSMVLARPRQPEWFEAIALKYTLPRARIVAEGRGAEVRAAERKLAALVRRIAKSLASTGVTVADIEALIERRLAERHVSSV